MGGIFFRKNVTRFITLVKLVLLPVLKYCSALALLLLSIKLGGEEELGNRFMLR